MQYAYGIGLVPLGSYIGTKRHKLAPKADFKVGMMVRDGILILTCTVYCVPSPIRALVPVPVHVHVRIHVRIHLHVRIHVHGCVCVGLHLQVHIHINIRVRVSVRFRVYVRRLCPGPCSFIKFQL